MAPGQCPRESIRDGEPGLGQLPRGRVSLGPKYQGRKKPVEEVLTGSPQGVKAKAKKPTNVAKTAEVLGKPDESPADFYNRLCEAFRVFIPFDPEAPENQWMITAAFVGQAKYDIKKKKKKRKKERKKEKSTEVRRVCRQKCHRTARNSQQSLCQSLPNSTLRSRKEDEAKSHTLGSCPVKVCTRSGTTP